MSDSQLTKFQKPADLMRYLETAKGAVAMALPKHLNPDRMLRLAVTCFSTTPALRNCSAQSILASIVVSSQLGLEPGVTGQAYLIPYGNTCTLVPGWQGLVGLLNNSGRATAWTGAVYEGDVFDFQLGSAPRCVHVPGENFGDAEKLKWVYACGKVNGSEQPIVEAWPMTRVWKHRDRFNKIGQKHYSYTHPEMYARKVVLLQVLKYMPRSIELNNAITAADASEAGRTTRVESGVVIDVPAETVADVQSPPASKQQHSQQNEAGGGQASTGTTQSGPDAASAGKRVASGEAAPANETETDGSAEPAPDAEGAPVGTGEIPTEPAALVKFVRQQVADRDLEESSAVAFLRAKKRCGASCRTLGDVAASGLLWLAENIDTVKDEISNQ